MEGEKREKELRAIFETISDEYRANLAATRFDMPSDVLRSMESQGCASQVMALIGVMADQRRDFEELTRHFFDVMESAKELGEIVRELIEVRGVNDGPTVEA
jgi:hypothetical protein|tara:strand:+ start:2541 stop:2846 length:306 start_codon:yes stop_codon:yes gene_type:complete